MNLLPFLGYCHKYKNMPDTLITCFIGNEYPLLFFSHLILFLQKNNVTVEAISTEVADSSAIKAAMTTIRFNGQVIFWFKDFHTQSIKKQQEWIIYFKTHRGPHKVIFFCGEESCVSLLHNSDIIGTVSIPNELLLQDISMIRFLAGDNERKTHASINAGLQVQVMSLDTLCLLSQYELVVGKNWNSFFTEWAPAIIDQTGSLFLLSQHFFSKKPHLFFGRWMRSYELYQDAFWPTFWADQIWRAYIYCDLMQQKKYIEAKKVQYKLPYSFIKRDWSSLHLTELRNAHDCLFQMDYRLKNGGSPVALELFFDMFFEHKFKISVK